MLDKAKKFKDNYITNPKRFDIELLKNGYFGMKIKNGRTFTEFKFINLIKNDEKLKEIDDLYILKEIHGYDRIESDYLVYFKYKNKKIYASLDKLDKEIENIRILIDNRWLDLKKEELADSSLIKEIISIKNIIIENIINNSTERINLLLQNNSKNEKGI